MTHTRSLPQYTDITKSLNCEDKPFLPAEMHGYISGIISGMKQHEEKESLNLIFSRFREEWTLTPETEKAIAHLVIISFQQLQSPDCYFRLLLPDDEETLAKRSEALAKWCQYFLSGLGAAGISEEALKRGNLMEAVHDILNISAIDYYDIGHDQEGEQSYFELVEHVRIAILLIYTENRDQGKGSRIRKQEEVTVH